MEPAYIFESEFHGAHCRMHQSPSVMHGYPSIVFPRSHIYDSLKTIYSLRYLPLCEHFCFNTRKHERVSFDSINCQICTTYQDVGHHLNHLVCDHLVRFHGHDSLTAYSLLPCWSVLAIFVLATVTIWFIFFSHCGILVPRSRI